MNNQPNPKLGATFYPGGMDDFYMPEVISPAPQRVMPEVPGQIQSNLASLELEASGPRRHSEPLSPEVPQDTRGGSGQNSHTSGHRPRQSSMQHQNSSFVYPDYNKPSHATTPQSRTSGFQGSGYQSDSQNTQGYSHQSSEFDRQIPQQNIRQNITGPQSQVYKSFGDSRNAYSEALDQPNFSPFPRLRNPPPNVPPSDEEKEATLEAARVNVLNSNDPEVQLAWAQDALSFVEVSAQNETRVARTQPARPQTPQVEHQLRVDALNIVSFLADQHHPKAEFMRGLWLEFGKFGFRIDKKEAFRSYKRAAEKGYARAEYRIGMSWEGSDDVLKAKQHYQEGSRLGDSASNYRLGMMTLLGQHGERQDFGRGVQLIRLSAQTADENAPQGAYVFGMLQARELPNINIPEIFLPLDTNGARVNLEKAAYLGFAKAQIKMGLAYELCQLGCNFDPALSLHYNALASRQGEAEADMAISKWFLCGYEGVFEKNEELAFSYAQRAAQDHLATAEFAMGYFNEIGMYVPVNLKEAKTWYERAAEHGNKDAVGRIEGITKEKTLSKKDHENVAIARIKSQYGSQKGKRPDRSRKTQPMTPIQDSIEADDHPPPLPKSKTAPAIPALSKDNVTMPEPSIPSASNASLNPYSGIQVPPRSASATPYPAEDGPPGRGDFRPSTATGFIAPHLMPTPVVRPSSAFGINPHLMNAPAPYPNAPGYGRQARPYSSMDDRPTGPPGRPNSAMENFRGGRGGYPGPGRGRENRTPSGPYSQRDYRAPGGPSIEGDRAGRGRGKDDRAAKPDQSQASRLDIGFSAPLEPSGGRNRLQKPSGSFPNSDGGRSDRPSSSQGSQVPPDRRGGGGSRPNSRPPSPGGGGKPHRQETAPASLPPSKPILPPSAQSTPQVPQKDKPLPSQGSSTPKPAPSPRPPGKGPRTFDEMGVPSAQKENECTVM